MISSIHCFSWNTFSTWYWVQHPYIIPDFPFLKYFYSINLCSFAKQLSENMAISYSSVATLVSPLGNILGRGTWTSTLNDNLFMLTRDWQYILLDFKQRKYLTWILKSKVYWRRILNKLLLILTPTLILVQSFFAAFASHLFRVVIRLSLVDSLWFYGWFAVEMKIPGRGMHFCTSYAVINNILVSVCIELLLY